MTVTLRTRISDEQVEYLVERADEVLWYAAVRFGRELACRPGGYAFQAAAQEQEQVASHVVEPEETVQEIVERRL